MKASKTTTNKSKSKSKSKSTTYKSKSKSKSKNTNKNNIRRNRSAYNFFYKHQRFVILQQHQVFNIDGPTQLKTAEEVEAFLLKTDGVSMKERKHIKTHGKITLQELTREIAHRWREADADIRSIYEELAKRDRERYEKENNMKNDESSRSSESTDAKAEVEEISEHTVSDSLCCGTDTQFLIIDEFTPRCIEEMRIDPELGNEDLEIGDYESYLSGLRKLEC